jgi:hypothetical protein
MKKIKKFVAIIAISAFILTIAHQPLAKSDDPLHHVTATIGWDGPDLYSQCVHTHNMHRDDCYVGLGMETWYDYWMYWLYGIPAYGAGYWIFEAGYGCLLPYNYSDPNTYEPTWEFHSIPVCRYSYNSYGADQWYQFNNGGVPYHQPSNGTSWVMHDTHSASLPTSIRINGKSYEYFHEKINHNNILYLSAEPTGDYYYIMTASPPPAEEYEFWYT